MVHLPQTKNLFEKIINIIFICLLASFTLQNLKKILEANLELWGYAIFGPKIPQFVASKIFWYKPLLLLSFTHWPFSLSKSFKKFLQWIQSYDNVPILGPKWSISPKHFFFWKIIDITLIYLLSPFIVQNLKKILPANPELWRWTIFVPKKAQFPK